MKRKSIYHVNKMTMLTMFLLNIVSQLIAQTDSLVNLPQYLFSHFDNGIMKLKTGKLTKAAMNYNTLTEKMTFYQNGSVLDLIKPESVDTVYISKRVFIPFEKAFYEVILNDRISFFIQHKSDLISKGRPAALGTTSQTSGPTSVAILSGARKTYNLKLPEEFEVEPYEIFWLRMNNEMHRFMNERQLLNIFPEKKDQLKDFIKESELNIKEPGELLKLATFCNKVMK